MRRWVWMVLLLAVLAVPRHAGAEPGLLVGARDDGLKWSTGLHRCGRARPRPARARNHAFVAAGPGRPRTPRRDARQPGRRAGLRHPRRRRGVLAVRRSAARRPRPGRVLRVSQPPDHALPADQRRRDLERAQPALLLEAPVRPRGQERGAREVRRAARALLGRPPHAAPVRQRRRPGRLDLGERQPERLLERLALADELHQGDGRRLPRQRPQPADLRHLRSPPVSDPVERAALGGAQRRGDRVDRRRRPPGRAAARGVRGYGAADSGRRPPDLVPGDRLPDADRRRQAEPLRRSRELAGLGAGRRPAAAAGSAARRQSRARPGDPARRQPADDVLPAAHRRGLQLPDPRRAKSRGVAVRSPLGGRVAQGLLRRLSLDRARGEREPRRLRQAQGCAGCAGWAEHRRQEGRGAGRDPLADQDHLPEPQARAVRIPAAPCAAHARSDGELEWPGREADPVPAQLDRVRGRDQQVGRGFGDADAAAEARALPRRRPLLRRQGQHGLGPARRGARRQLAGRASPRTARCAWGRGSRPSSPPVRPSARCGGR